MKLIHAFSCIALIAFATTGSAQTCASPIILATTPQAVTGTTCAGTQQLPTFANGAINGTQQIVHRIRTTAPTTGLQVSVQPEPSQDVAVFVCSNQCSPTATCVAAVDDNGGGGAETASIPSAPGDYYVIVQNVGTCGSYSLVFTGPLND
jgi:hypothetical protein